MSAYLKFQKIIIIFILFFILSNNSLSEEGRTIDYSRAKFDKRYYMDTFEELKYAEIETSDSEKSKISVVTNSDASDVDSSNSSAEKSRQDKVKEFCEENPTSDKCQKFLDSRYRRHSDVDRAAKIDPLNAARSEKSYKDELRRELLSFCRTEPDAPRCASVKSVR